MGGRSGRGGRPRKEGGRPSNARSRRGSGTDPYAAPSNTAFVASALVHLGLFLFVWWTQTARPSPPQFETIAIELVSPPSSEEGNAPPQEELTVETPEEPEPEPEEEEPPPPEPEAEEPAPVEEEPEPEPEEPEPEEESPPVEETTPPPPADDEAEPGAPEPDPDAETTGEDINVRMEGLRRDYPAYYSNIIRQIRRCFRWQGGGDELEATIRFYIERNGTTTDMSVVQPSGNLTFDLEAMGAVECAGTGNRLGALPEDLPFERLPVEFDFRPMGGG